MAALCRTAARLVSLRLKNTPASALTICRLYTEGTERTPEPYESTDINQVVWAGIVVRKRFINRHPAILVQNHINITVPVLIKGEKLVEKLRDVKLGTNVAVKGCLDGTNVTRKQNDQFVMERYNFISAEEMEIVEPEDIPKKQVERKERIAASRRRLNEESQNNRDFAESHHS